MLRRMGKQILLISIPLFILLLINYRNHGHLVRREKPLENESNEVSQVPLWPQLENRVSKRSEWEVLGDGTVIHRGNVQQHRNYTILKYRESQCSSLRLNQSSFVVVVESDIVNFEQRQLIRDTWALAVLQEIANYRVVFLVGLTNNSQTQEKLDFENLIYEDIVQIAIYEDFPNLTHKSIHMLYWYTKFCANANFLFKTDDDIYLHIPNIVHLFQSTSLNGSLLCHQNKSRKILRTLKDIHYFVYSVRDRNKKEVVQQIRNKFQKYLIGLDKLPGTLYPEYCSGFAYAMNYDVASKLLETSSKIPYLGIEDVFITGLCREKCNITITNSAHFRLKPFIQPLEAKCAFQNGRINSNEMTVSDIRKLWTHVNTQGYYCRMIGSKSVN